MRQNISEWNCFIAESSGGHRPSDGSLYGTTYGGGAHGDGIVFKITPQGALTTLHSFNGTDGANPVGGLMQATDGNLYGTTTEGGDHGSGRIFKITISGTMTKLHSFDLSDGNTPYGTLLQATDGNFYGTTYAGGSYGWDVVFRLSVGFGPFIKALPGSGKPGATIRILGTNLDGATSITFNGIAAAFVVVEPSEIIASVPIGATTGTVQVITPGGALDSIAAFQVLP
jgi:uncharacterized repeat protein (TIGR03803 family)